MISKKLYKKEVQKYFLLEHILGTDTYIIMKIDANGNYKIFYMPEGGGNITDINLQKEIPLSLPQYVHIVTSYYGVEGFRSQLYKDEFYTKPFDCCPSLRGLAHIIPDFQIPKW